MKDFSEVRSFAGMVARAGAAQIATVSYLNNDVKSIYAGQFVTRSDDGCKLVSANTGMILGAVVAMGVLKEFKPGTNLSVLAANYGDEIWVQATDSASFNIGDRVFVDVETSNASNSGIETNFYVTKINGNLIKIMRQDSINKTGE